MLYRNKLKYFFKLSKRKYCNNYCFENSNDSEKNGKDLNKLLTFNPRLAQNKLKKRLEDCETIYPVEVANPP